MDKLTARELETMARYYEGCAELCRMRAQEAQNAKKIDELRRALERIARDTLEF